jgi:predicted TIM-barrel fold metal-dependent hydrolase
VFERFPRLRFVITESSAAAYPPLLKQLDGIMESIRKGAIGELKYTAEHALPRSATEYFHQNCWIGASFPGPLDVEARAVIGADRFMWGSDYPHDEGTPPYTREHLRQVFHAVGEQDLRKILGGNAAALYDFDLAKLAPLAAQYGPSVEEVAQPLDRLPDEPNSALLKAAGQAFG